MMESKVIDVGSDFTRFPAGRYRADGPYSGERFREDILMPLLRDGRRVVIKLDGAMGYGSSFLEEVFGGLVRGSGFTREHLLASIELQSADQSLIDEIREYLTATRH